MEFALSLTSGDTLVRRYRGGIDTEGSTLGTSNGNIGVIPRLSPQL